MRKIVLLILGVFVFSISSYAQRPDLPGSLVIDLGLNSWADTPTGADLNTVQSKTVNITYYYDLPIGSSGLAFTPGIGLGAERYSFDQSVTLVSTIDANNNRSVAVANLDDVYGDVNDYKKSKLGLSYLDIPIELRYYTNASNYNRGARFAIGVKAGLLYSSFTKVKYDDAAADSRQIKDRQDLGINRFRYGVQARAGIGGFSIFGYYALSDLFDTAPTGGEKTKTLTIGISLTGF